MGRFHRWPPAYWRSMLWSDFAIYVYDLNRKLEEKAEAEGGFPHPFREEQPPPTRSELSAIPWAGEGVDPLEAAFEAESYVEGVD